MAGDKENILNFDTKHIIIFNSVGNTKLHDSDYSEKRNTQEFKISNVPLLGTVKEYDLTKKEEK